MTQREKTAYHEAGHFVLGLTKLFGEPDYPSPTWIYIDETNDNKGQVKGFSFYKDYTQQEAIRAGNLALVNTPNYPQHSAIKNNPIEINKLKKEAIQSIGGLLSEHLCCNKPRPKFDGSDDKKYSSDLTKYNCLIKSIYRTGEGLTPKSSDEEYEESEQLQLQKSNDLWDEAVTRINKNPKIIQAIDSVKNRLLKKNRFEGQALENLVSETKDILEQ